MEISLSDNVEREESIGITAVYLGVGYKGCEGSLSTKKRREESIFFQFGIQSSVLLLTVHVLSLIRVTMCGRRDRRGENI